MNTDSDIELNELEAIEQRLDTELGGGVASHERGAGRSSSGFAIAFEAGFESS